MKKKTARLKRSVKSRMRIKAQDVNRLCVFRTPRHIYAQVIIASGSEVLVSASTLDKEVRGRIQKQRQQGSGGNGGSSGCRTRNKSRH